MKKLFNLQNYKDDKEGKVTPEIISEQIEEDAHKMENIVYAATDADGNVMMGWSDMTDIEVLGMLEQAKNGVGEGE